MRISVTIFVILISTCIVNASVLDPVIENVVHLKASKPPSGVAGIWKKRTIWKPRWVKEWKSAKVMKPVWKKVWSPVQIREWVPIPKPPPGWDSVSTPLAAIHPKPHNAPVKDSAGHDSFAAHSSTNIPLWDPVPYPESQQPPPPPPPPPFPQPAHNADSSCPAGDCDSSHSATFNHQQISEIIGPRYNTPEYFQNAEYSETVNHLTRLPPEGNSWRPPLPGFQTENRFTGFPRLPEFLVPPTVPVTDFRPQLNQNRQQQFNSVPAGQISHSLGVEPQNGLRQWTPSPPETKIKGHFITKAPDHPYKFQYPEVELQGKNNTTTAQKESVSHSQNKSKEKQSPNVSNGVRPPSDGDFIQEAHLVGEYHYSEFDLPNIKQELKKPETSEEEKERVKPSPQQKVKMTAPKVQKPKINQPPGENKLTKPESHRQQSGQHVQKKHVSSFPLNSSNSNFFQQQEAILKEIFPMLDFTTGNDSSLHQNQRFSLPLHENNQKRLETTISAPTGSASAGSGFSSSITKADSQQQKKNYPIYEIPPKQSLPLQVTGFNANSLNSKQKETESIHQEKENYPIYEIPQIETILPPNHRFSPPFVPEFKPLNTNGTIQQQKANYEVVVDAPKIPASFPTNHRFSSPGDAQLPRKPLRLNHYTTRLIPISPDKVEKSEKPLEKQPSVQLVFPTTPVASSGTVSSHNPSAEGLQKTTTEPYSVIFSSSLLYTTEAVTTSPVVIVTPLTHSQS